MVSLTSAHCSGHCNVEEFCSVHFEKSEAPVIHFWLEIQKTFPFLSPRQLHERKTSFGHSRRRIGWGDVSACATTSLQKNPGTPHHSCQGHEQGQSTPTQNQSHRAIQTLPLQSSRRSSRRQSSGIKHLWKRVQLYSNETRSARSDEWLAKECRRAWGTNFKDHPQYSQELVSKCFFKPAKTLEEVCAVERKYDGLLYSEEHLKTLSSENILLFSAKMAIVLCTKFVGLCSKSRTAWHLIRRFTHFFWSKIAIPWGKSEKK